MNIDHRVTRRLGWGVALLAIALGLACGSTGEGSRDALFSGDGLPADILIRPQVTLTVPATQIPGPVTGIATNAAITAAFTKDMAPASLNGASFTLAGPGSAAVAGAVTYASRVASFTPSAGLAGFTTYTATVTMAATDLAGNQLTGNQAPAPAPSNYVWTFTTGASPDTIRPQVTLTVPATSLPGPTTGIAVNSAISAAFSEDMAAANINATTFKLTGPGLAPVAGAVTYASRTATFTPAAALAYSTTYTATITAGATDLAGNGLAGNLAALPAASSYVWTFTTGLAPDTTPPQVTVTVPVTSTPPAQNVALNTAISAAFTEDLAAGSITAASFTLAGPGGTAVAGSVSYASRTAVFTPAALLALGTTYTATLSSAITDLAGNHLVSAYAWTFTTSLPTSTRPQVTVTVPVTSAPIPTDQVAINTTISAAFTEDMAPATLSTASFTLAGPGVAPVAGSVSYASRIATFTPLAALAYSTTYTATITSAATDLSGNQLAGNPAALPAASNYVWTFTTGIAPDLKAPQVNGTTPATSVPGPTLNVPLNTAISVGFTKDMAAGSITAASFTLSGPALTPVAGSVSYALRSAVFTPAAMLVLGVTYTATVTTAVTDLAGNNLPSAYVWSFITGPSSDTTLPQVTVTVPVTSTPGPTLLVPTNTAISAAFSEDMAPATLTTASFTLTGPGATPVAGSVSYASRIAVFTPLAPLTFGATYTATVTTVATDLSGNPLAGNLATPAVGSNYVWTFSVGATASNPPTLTLTSPANLAIGVNLGSTVNGTFSSAMDPLTLTGASFTVQASGSPLGSPLLGAVVYDPLTKTATFSPSSPLAANTSYTATFTGAKDMTGLALAPGLIPNPWTFTTGSTNVTPPAAVALGSAGVNGIMATSAITNTGAGTMINGNVNLDPGTSCGLLPVQVNGTIHINDTVSHQARIDLLAGYNYAKNLPPGITIPGGANISAIYRLGIAPGTYTSGSTMLVSTPLILDGGGNANAVWVFQIGSSLTTTASMSLVNGAQAKNIFWVNTLDGTVGVGTIFYGTILSGRDVTAKTGSVINGRILAGATLAGTIALDTNIVNLP